MLRCAPAWAGALALAAFLRTLAPAVFTLDSPELTAAAHSLGIVHAPGYPVYLLVGHAFLKLPLGDAGWQMNLLSALAAAATVALLAWLVQRMTGSRLAGFVTGLSYGLSFYVWSMAVIAEVYTFQALLLAAALALVWQWRSDGRVTWLAGAVFIAGLAAANSPVAVLWWPGLLVLGLATEQRQRLRHAHFALLAGALGAGLAFLLYLPLRSLAGPDFVYVGSYDALGRFHALDLSQPASLLWFLSGRQFSWLMAPYTLVQLLGELGRFATWLWAAFLGVGLPLGVWGLAALWRRERSLAAGLLLAVLPFALFLVSYAAPDKEMMFAPFFAVWALLLGVGLAELARNLPRPAAALALLLPAALLLVNLRYADVSQMAAPHETSVARLTEAAPGAVYLAHWGDASAMQYQQLVYGLRPDVQVINVFFISPDDLMAFIGRSLAMGRPVYASYRQGLPVERFRIAALGGDYQLLESRRFTWTGLVE
jgi:hypothetical protein